MKIRVECYSGHKGDERPVKFWLEDAVLFIESILDQWNSTDTQYYRVRADDGWIRSARHEGWIPPCHKPELKAADKAN